MGAFQTKAEREKGREKEGREGGRKKEKKKEAEKKERSMSEPLPWKLASKRKKQTKQKTPTLQVIPMCSLSGDLLNEWTRRF